MALLLLALVALFLGPLLGSGVSKDGPRQRVLDGLIALAVGVLCLGALLPHAVDHLGPSALLVALAALVLPELARRLRPRDSVAWDLVGLGLLALHAAIDGAALATVEHGMGVALGLAVSLHRLPVGFLVYRAARKDAAGPRASATGWAAVSLLALATVGGFLSGASIEGDQRPWLVGGLEAMVAGMLLHVVVEQLSVWRRAVLSRGGPG